MEQELGGAGLGEEGMARCSKFLAGCDPREENEEWNLSGQADNETREARRQYSWGNDEAGRQERLSVERRWFRRAIGARRMKMRQ